MNREDIIRMAREAGFAGGGCEALFRLTALVAAAERERIGDQWAEQLKTAIEDEREACARVCEAIDEGIRDHEDVAACAAAIRARGNT